MKFIICRDKLQSGSLQVEVRILRRRERWGCQEWGECGGHGGE